MAVKRRAPSTTTTTTTGQIGRGPRADANTGLGFDPSYMAPTQGDQYPTYDQPQGGYDSSSYVPNPDTTTNPAPGMSTGLNPDRPGYTDPAGGGATSSNKSSRWDPGLQAQMDAIGARYGRTWRDDEYEQWIGSNGYIMKDDIDGTGRTLGAWKGGDIDPYWQSRMVMHATGDYYGNGTTPGDANSNRASQGGSAPAGYSQGQLPGFAGSPGGPRAGTGEGTQNVDPRGSNPTDIMTRLQQLMDSGGRFNQDLVNSRTESAREGLERRRVGELEGDRAILADRGLLGSGAEISALGRLGNELGSEYAGTIRDIYSDEAGRADERYVQALSLATGMSIEEAKRAVEMAQIHSNDRNADADRSLQAGLGFGRLDLDRQLGFGRLDLDRLDSMNQFNLGQGRLNLDRDLGAINAGNTDDDEILRLLQILYGQGGQLSNGYQG